MHLGNAIATHEEWKTALRNAIAGSATLDVVTISADNRCEFGQWLYGEGKRLFGELPIHAHCVETHRLFHVEAGKIAEAINVRNFVDANGMLASNTPFSKTSSALADSILQLRQEAVTSPGIISLIAKLSV
ncbi:MAG: hypothetical protein A3H32_06290 [Betaproteobacteria bacterium RIFCSPLOWO2_02_FULL_63_19]|nr:MAG: hypothetical protein A3H32_06290 [Betaproteobacteria bacterium RIFCSPLOWO2_02_FULL_63_19]